MLPQSLNRTLPTRQPTPLTGQLAILRVLCVRRLPRPRRGVNSDPFSPCPAFCFHFLALLRSLFSISFALFHFPYALSPLFATLTKTAGVCTNNSQNGTKHPTRRRVPTSNGQTLQRFFDLSPFLSCSSALFCTHQKCNPFVFKRFRTLCQKHPGWGVAGIMGDGGVNPPLQGLGSGGPRGGGARSKVKG